jgi:hypothetical protein
MIWGEFGYLEDMVRKYRTNSRLKYEFSAVLMTIKYNSLNDFG